MVITRDWGLGDGGIREMFSKGPNIQLVGK